MTDLSKLSDRELLELAAEAGGAVWAGNLQTWLIWDGRTNDDEDGVWREWLPQENEVDALRLAVKLRIFLDQEKIDQFAYLFGGAMTDHDEVPATCRAITLVAAAITLAKRAA